MVTAHPSATDTPTPFTLARDGAPEAVALNEGAAPDAEDVKADSERKCLVTGLFRPKESLIRFVVGPDRSVVPDLAQRLPGRGLWVTASHAALAEAVRKNPFSRAAKTKVKVDPALPAFVETLLTKRCLDLLGLARGAGLIVTGQPQVEQAARQRELAVILVADDAGQDGLKKLRYLDVPVMRGLTRTQLGAALGHDHLVYLGLKPHALTQKLQTEISRWLSLRPEAVPSTPDTPLTQEHRDTDAS